MEQRSNITTLLVTIVGLSVTVGLAGWFLGAYLGKDLFPGLRTEQANNGSKPVKTSDLTGRSFNDRLFLLPPIVTDVAANELLDNHKVWVRLRVGLVLKPDGGGLDRYALSAITNNFLAYIRTVSLSDLRGSVGLMHLKEDLLERANVLSHGKVSEVVIPTFIIE